MRELFRHIIARQPTSHRHARTQQKLPVVGGTVSDPCEGEGQVGRRRQTGYCRKELGMFLRREPATSGDAQRITIACCSTGLDGWKVG